MALEGGGFSLGTLWVEIKASVDEATSALQKFGDDTDRLVADQKSKWEGLASVGESFMGIGAGLTAAVTLPLVGVGMAAVKTAEDLNSARVSFTTMLGSAEAADKMLKDLQQFAATTPFEFPDLVASAQRMKALGFEAKEVIPTLRTVGDAAAAMGKGKDYVDGITKALGDMRSKGKVSAEEMNQLAERGIGGWKILADAIGTDIPTAMKKAESGAVSAAVAIPALLEGMNKQFGGSMEAMSKTLTGQWSNFKDQITAALLPIGQAIVPALSALLPILSAVLGKVAEAAKWFADLPDPIKNAALVVAALAAAIGPLLVGLGGIMAAIGPITAAVGGLASALGLASTAALGPFGIAIAAVVAALVALGTWVYQNWDPIVRTLTEAWAGLTEAWTAAWNGISGFLTGIWGGIAGSAQTVWGPVAKFFNTIWDGVAGYFETAWKAISGALTSVWNGIKSVAESVWNSITGAIQGFLKWAEKIPGVGKLMNLDDVWRSADKASDSLKTTAIATKTLGTETNKTAAAVTTLTAEQKKAIKEAGKHAEAMRDAWDAAHKRYEDQAKEAEKTRQWFEKAYAEIERLDAEMAKSVADLATDYAKAHEAMRTEATKTVSVIVPLTERIAPPVQDAIRANRELGDSYKVLGTTSAEELNKHYGKAKEAYDKITASGTASATDIDKAWIAMEKARQEAVVAAGEAIPAEQKKMLEKMEEQLGTSKTKQKDKWGEFTTEVSTVFTNFAQGIAKSLFDGDLSFGEKAKEMLTGLGEAVTASFIEPATAAIGKFISGALADLMSGKGLGGVMDGIKGIGSAFSGIFGGGASAAGDVAGAAGGAGSAGGAAGAAGSVAGAGMSAIVGVVSGVVSAVSGVISNFQFAAMNKSLDLIERYTRRSEIHLQYILEDGVNKWLPNLDQINGFLWEKFQPAFASLMTTTEDLLPGIVRAFQFPIDWTMKFTDMNRQTLYEIRDAIYDARQYLYEMRDNTQSMKEAMTAGATWTVNFTGDPIASQVGAEIMRQLRLQGVNLV
jgi:tape measure domain-containing protein